MTIKVKCINKIRDAKGNIIKYQLIDQTGKPMEATANQIKAEMQRDIESRGADRVKYEFINLKIDRAGRLVDKAVVQDKNSIKNKPKDRVKDKTKDKLEPVQTPVKPAESLKPIYPYTLKIIGRYVYDAVSTTSNTSTTDSNTESINPIKKKAYILQIHNNNSNRDEWREGFPSASELIKTPYSNLRIDNKKYKYSNVKVVDLQNDYDTRVLIEDKIHRIADGLLKKTSTIALTEFNADGLSLSRLTADQQSYIKRIYTKYKSLITSNSKEGNETNPFHIANKQLYIKTSRPISNMVYYAYLKDKANNEPSKPNIRISIKPTVIAKYYENLISEYLKMEEANIEQEGLDIVDRLDILRENNISTNLYDDVYAADADIQKSQKLIENHIIRCIINYYIRTKKLTPQRDASGNTSYSAISDFAGNRLLRYMLSYYIRNSKQDDEELEDNEGDMLDNDDVVDKVPEIYNKIQSISNKMKNSYIEIPEDIEYEEEPDMNEDMEEAVEGE